MTRKQSSRKLTTRKLSRSQIDFALPRLTIDEFARLVGAEPHEITDWLSRMHHDQVIRLSQFSKWRHDAVPISEPIVRVYLHWRLLKDDERALRAWIARIEQRRRTSATTNHDSETPREEH